MQKHQHNAGGGGGSNYTSGGEGGLGWTCNTTNTGKGFGGISLSAHISSSRVFMGGGGGGGQQNNGVGTNGGRGGGIIFIKAGRITTNTICATPLKISVNGESIALAGNDGSGGGGAAGSALLQVTSFSITSTCSLSINANGGTGGTVNSDSHGGGGGGGQGVVIFTSNQPTINVTTTTNNGLAGFDNASGTSITATSGGGTNNSGIFFNAVTPLPIDLVSFSANCNNVTESVKIEWITATEKNNDYFIIEKSTDALNWIEINKTKGAGNSYYTIKYKIEDYEIDSEFAYYRLTQVDFDHQSKTFKNLAYVENCLKNKLNFDFYPNPAQEIIYLKNNGFADITISNAIGQEIETIFITNNELNISHLSNGVYFIKLVDKTGKSKTKKFVKNML